MPKTKEEQRKYNREYMRKYNSTEKGKAYNRKHIKEWRKKTKKPHGERPQRLREYREVIVDFLIKRDGYICGFCKKSLDDSKVHIDHIIPIALGGPNTMENIRLAHAECNLAASLAIRKESSGY